MKRKQRGKRKPNNARTVRGKSNSRKSKTPRKYYTGGSMY